MSATKREAHASEPTYFGEECSEGSDVRQGVTHLCSFGFLPGEGAGQKRDLRKSATSSAMRWSRGVSKTSGAYGAMNGG
jgi:hypothetical protein